MTQQDHVYAEGNLVQQRHDHTGASFTCLRACTLCLRGTQTTFLTSVWVMFMQDHSKAPQCCLCPIEGEALRSPPLSLGFGAMPPACSGYQKLALETSTACLTFTTHCSLLPCISLGFVAVQDDSKAPQCCLCPIEGGALKPTTEPGLWCHATCLQWIPEVSVGDERRMEPVTHIRSIQKERWELNCCICKSVPLLYHCFLCGAWSLQSLQLLSLAMLWSSFVACSATQPRLKCITSFSCASQVEEV